MAGASEELAGHDHSPVNAATTDGGSKTVFGIKAKLSLTLLVFTALTAMACTVAWLAFEQIERAVLVVTDRSIPEITLALNIAEVSADITASAPGIMASRTPAERAERRAQLDRAGENLGGMIARWKTLGIAPDVANSLSGVAAGIANEIDIADRSVRSRLDLATRLDRQTVLLDQIHEAFLAGLEPLIDDAVFDLVIKSETGNGETAEALKLAIERGTSRLDQLSSLKADANLLVGQLRDTIAHADTDDVLVSNAALATARDEFSAGVAGLNTSADEALSGISRNLLELSGAARSRDGTLQGRLEALAGVYQVFLERVDARLLDVRQNLTVELQAITERQTTAMTDLVDTGALALLNLASLRGDGNLAAGILRETAGVSDLALLAPLKERFDAAAGQMDRALRQIPGTPDLTELRSIIGTLLGLGREQDNLFVLNRARFEQLDKARLAINQIRLQSVALQSAVTNLVRIAQSMSEASVLQTQQVIQTNKLAMLAISVIGVLSAIAVMLAYVGPRLVRPIEETTRAMSRLAAGDAAVEIPGRDRQDELGRMAHALGVFRDITIEIQKSNLREIETARRRLSDAIESISEAFSLYDIEDRLVVSNRKYGTLVHPEIADDIRPGLTFEQIIRRALEAGFIEEARGREEEWLTERVRRHRDPGPPHTMRRIDGVWIMVSERKTAEGGIVAVYSDITELKEREIELSEKSTALEQLSSQLSKYLSPQIYQSIFTGQQAATVASQRKKLTVFFSDLEGFTEIADRLESEDLSQLLNEYLTEMSRIALEHGATIDKYVGDAIMIFFGDPVSRGIREDAIACVRMAIAMQKRIGELSVVWSGHGITTALKCRIGIATGFCTVGNFGSEDRMDYTIIGGTVNLASRLESVVAPGSILVSGETQILVNKEIDCREHQTIKIKGFAYPVKTYLVAEDGDRTGSGLVDDLRGKLEVDLGSMTESEREDAVRLLGEMMSKLSGRKSDKTP